MIGRSARAGALAAAFAALFFIAVLLVPTLAGGALATIIPGDKPATVGASNLGASGGLSCVGRALATVRTIESGGNYLARSSGGATGAYQMIDSTWRSWARSSGLDPTPWPSAADAPPEVQDTAAAWKVTSFLAAGDPVEQVPVAWYLGHPIVDPGDPEWDAVPFPQFNTLTPRQYQSRWLSELARRGGCTPAAAAAGAGQFPGDLNVTEPAFQPYPNGELPEQLLVEVQPGRRLVPAAAAAFRAMAAAAERDGVELRITSAYRSRAEQARLVGLLGAIVDGGLAADVGASPHGLGVAADLDVLPPGVEAWLRVNASRYCFANALGAALQGREPWHWAWTGAATGCMAAT